MVTSCATRDLPRPSCFGDRFERDARTPGICEPSAMVPARPHGLFTLIR